MEVQIYSYEVLVSQDPKFLAYVDSGDVVEEYAINPHVAFDSQSFYIYPGDNFCIPPTWDSQNQRFVLELIADDGLENQGSALTFPLGLGLPFKAGKTCLHILLFYGNELISTTIVHQNDAEETTRPMDEGTRKIVQEQHRNI